MTSELMVTGASWLRVPEDTNLQLDEMVFATTSAALRSAGLARHQVGLSVVSSLDLYDGRSISNALTAPAAAAYLNEEFRVEGDALAAVVMALGALIAGQVDCAVVVGLHVPEIARGDEKSLRRFRELISSYTFDAHLDRPVGMTSEVTLGLHAALRVDQGLVDLEEMAERTASDISRGARRRGVREAVDADAVLNSARVVHPLTELMMPAATTGVGVVVLAAGTLARRCPHPLARVTGWGMSTGWATSQPGWLDQPTASSARAATDAYRGAGIERPLDHVDSLEMTDLSPALSVELVESLGLTGLAPDRINPSGGVRSSFPGNANGVLRLIEAAETLATGEARGHVVVHAMDDFSGLVTSTSSVLVLEEL